MIQSHASYEQIFMAKNWKLKVIVLTVTALALVLVGGVSRVGEAEFSTTYELQVLDRSGNPVGKIEINPLGLDGALRLAFVKNPDLNSERKIEWWQLAKRDDRSGYPRIDPQSGGSGLPGAKGEDEDPAYYSERDFVNSVLAPLIFEEGKFWLLDRPTHDSGFRFESWLVERTGEKSVTLLTGIRWGITINDDQTISLHQPRPLTHHSHFNWHESLRISGFGSGWEISTAYHSTLP